MSDAEVIKARLREALILAEENVRSGAGGPFGCVIYKNGSMVSQGVNRVTLKKDPTAHAEMEAIRSACAELNSWQLEGCEIYASSEPCPMCAAAIFWAKPQAVYYANPVSVAARFGFDDSFINTQLPVSPADRTIPFIYIPCEECEAAFSEWQKSETKIPY